MPKRITPPQLKRLQTLYGRFAAHEIGGNTREARLRYATTVCGRAVASFGELTREEGKLMIDGLHGALGMPVGIPKAMSRDQARRHALDGRSDGAEFAASPQIVSAEDLAVIESYYSRLGWNRAQFDGWLRSPRSPLSKRSNPRIATKADANRVRWALKGMLVHAGLWEERHAS